MQIPVKSAEGGFTLIEFMIAVLILMVGLFAVLTSIDVSMKQNLSNKMRNEAVVLAEQFLVNNRSVLYANLANNDQTLTIQSGNSRMQYRVITTVVPVTAISSRVSVEVRWLERGDDPNLAAAVRFHSHSVSTVVTDTVVS